MQPTPSPPQVSAVAALGHDDACSKLISAGLEEASACGDTLASAQLLHTRAGLLAGRGDAADALNTFHDVLGRYQVCLDAIRCAGSVEAFKNMPHDVLRCYQICVCFV